MKKTISILTILGAVSVLNAGESSHYLSVVAGKLDLNKIVYGDIDGYENNYKAYEDTSITGLDYTWIKEVSNSSVLVGVRPQILLNEGSFFDGGFFNVNFLAGKVFNDFKLYANVGYGLNSLSEYTVSSGLNYGLTARYDFSKHFSAALSYNIYDMKIASEENNNPTSSYKANGVLANLSFKF